MITKQMRLRAYMAFADRCIAAGEGCERCCDWCRPMVDAALDAAIGESRPAIWILPPNGLRKRLRRLLRKLEDRLSQKFFPEFDQ